MERREHGDPAHPEVLGARPGKERLLVPPQEVRAGDVFGGAVHQVPVIDVREARHVGAVDGGLFGRLAPPVAFDKEQEAEEPSRSS